MSSCPEYSLADSLREAMIRHRIDPRSVSHVNVGRRSYKLARLMEAARQIHGDGIAVEEVAVVGDGFVIVPHYDHGYAVAWWHVIRTWEKPRGKATPDLMGVHRRTRASASEPRVRGEPYDDMPVVPLWLLLDADW